MGFQEITMEEELLKLLNISKKTLACLRNRKGFVCIELRRYGRVYFEGDVVEWVKQNSKKKT